MPHPQRHYDDRNAADDPPATWLEWAIWVAGLGVVALVLLGKWARHVAGH